MAVMVVGVVVVREGGSAGDGDGDGRGRLSLRGLAFPRFLG